MMKSKTVPRLLRNALTFLYDLPAWSAIFLPFTFNISPWDGIQASDLIFVALPFFLPIAFGIFRLRLFFKPIPGMFWTCALWLPALAPAVLLAAKLYTSIPSSNDLRAWLLIAFHGAAIALAIVAAAIIRRRRVPDTFAPLLLGHFAYLVNAGYLFEQFHENLQRGGYITIAACTLYLAETVWLITHAWTWHARHPSPQGLCPVCGYDLRATPHRCPECGTPAQPAPLPTPI